MDLISCPILMELALSFELRLLTRWLWVLLEPTMLDSSVFFLHIQGVYESIPVRPSDADA